MITKPAVDDKQKGLLGSQMITKSFGKITVSHPYNLYFGMPLTRMVALIKQLRVLTENARKKTKIELLLSISQLPKAIPLSYTHTLLSNTALLASVFPHLFFFLSYLLKSHKHFLVPKLPCISLLKACAFR